MRISIVTPSFNQGQFIEKTIRSVMEQSHADYEHIIMDGGSTDATISLLRKYSHLQWTSGRDGGQSNAINMGFARATGEILAWINSDDFYERGAFAEVNKYFEEHPECMVLYGEITYVDKEGKSLFTITGDDIDRERLIACPDIVRQPSTFWRRRVLEEVGALDESLRLVMDFDFFLRISARYPFHYLQRNLSYFRMYDENKTSTLRRRQAVEFYKVFRKQGIRLDRPRLRYLASKFAESNAAGRMVKAIVRSMRKRKH